MKGSILVIEPVHSFAIEFTNGLKRYLDFKFVIEEKFPDEIETITSYEAVIVNISEFKDWEDQLKHIRDIDYYIPISTYTYNYCTEEMLKVLEIADIYLPKSMYYEELALRLISFIKRSRGFRKKTYKFEFADYLFDYTEFKIINKKSGSIIHIQGKLADILKCFCEHINQPVSKKEILFQVWGNDDYFTVRTMDVYLSRLRKHFSVDDRVEITKGRNKLMLKVA